MSTQRGTSGVEQRYVCPVCGAEMPGPSMLCSGSFLERDHPANVAPIVARVPVACSEFCDYFITAAELGSKDEWAGTYCKLLRGHDGSHSALYPDEGRASLHSRENGGIA